MIQQKNKCIFLDRDGVLNLDRNTYTYQIEDFVILPGVDKSLAALKEAGFLRIVITNQAGISKGLYTRKDMQKCHDYLQTNVDHNIEAFYYSPYHPTITESLSRKPDSLMFEKAIARFSISAGESWMIGDQERDIVPAKKLAIRTVKIQEGEDATEADFVAKNLEEAVEKILTSSAHHR